MQNWILKKEKKKGNPSFPKFWVGRKKANKHLYFRPNLLLFLLFASYLISCIVVMMRWCKSALVSLPTHCAQFLQARFRRGRKIRKQQKNDGAFLFWWYDIMTDHRKLRLSPKVNGKLVEMINNKRTRNTLLILLGLKRKKYTSSPRYWYTSIGQYPRPFLRSSIESFWITPACSKERKYHIFRQYWYTRNVPIFINTGTFQYLGPQVYFFPSCHCCMHGGYISLGRGVIYQDFSWFQDFLWPKFPQFYGFSAQFCEF